jgi:hypothetical protein
MRLRTVWSFIAGDSKLAPLGAGVAVIIALALVRYVPAAGAWAGAIYVAIIALGLVAGVFERS